MTTSTPPAWNFLHECDVQSHRIGTCYLDPVTGETVMPGDFFGEKELRWKRIEIGNGHDAEPEPARSAIGAGPLCPKRESPPDEETSDVPFPVQSWMFESLIESEIDHLHEIINDHHDELVAMARRRHRTGHALYGSKGYQWDAKTRLRNVLEELSDGGTYCTMGPIE